MEPAVLIKLRPLGPWRSGPGDGARDHVDPVFGSDRLFSALTLGMRQLGLLDEWLDATARRAGAPAVAFTSLFPFGSEGLFAPPPASLWPPPAAQVTAPSPVFLNKMRWNAARFVPVTLVESILLGQTVLADQWVPDSQTGCLLRRDRPSSSPFRLTTRTSAAVDRASTAVVHVHAAAAMEFEPGAGLWTAVRFADDNAREAWGMRLQAAFRLLADTGFGGHRSRGWGQTEAPDFQHGTWPGVLMPKLARKTTQPAASDEAAEYWLLSLYSPGSTDAVDWSAGDYALTVRGGFVHDSGQKKKQSRLVSEGSVLAASQDLTGTAVDVAPEGAVHPVYRAGFALALRLPVIEIAPVKKEAAVEMATDVEALEPAPCDSSSGDAAMAEILAAALEAETDPESPAAPEEPQPEIGTPEDEPEEEAPDPDEEPELDLPSPDEPQYEEGNPSTPEDAMPTTGEPEAGLAPEPLLHPEVARTSQAELTTEDAPGTEGEAAQEPPQRSEEEKPDEV